MHPLGFVHILNGVKLQTLAPLVLIKQQQVQLYEQKERCCSHLTFGLSLDLREWTPSRPVSQSDFRQNVETVTAPRCISYNSIIENLVVTCQRPIIHRLLLPGVIKSITFCKLSLTSN
jgi:hypothetical protein